MHALAYLPCELKPRDLAPRMAVADALARRGVSAIVGQMWSILRNLEKGPRGIYLANTANRVQARIAVSAKRFGHIVLGMDQEALPFAGGAWLVNVVPAMVEACAQFLVATDAHRDAFAQAYPQTPVTAVGNPRLDLVRSATPPRPMAEPYVLVNTGFGLTNSVWGDRQVAIDHLMANANAMTPEIVATRLAFEEASLREILSLVSWAELNLDRRLVIRPHPAENPAPWRALASDKCRIVEGEPAVPWIAHADIVIHANSTTGLEAAVRKRPCLNLLDPAFSAWTERFVMSAVNVVVPSAAAAAALIAAGQWDEWRAQATFVCPDDSAARIAAVVKPLLAAAPPLGGAMRWTQYERQDVERAKFTATADEFRALTKQRVVPLDDSLVMVRPD